MDELIKMIEKEIKSIDDLKIIKLKTEQFLYYQGVLNGFKTVIKMIELLKNNT